MIVVAAAVALVVAVVGSDTTVVIDVSIHFSAVVDRIVLMLS